jgi:hypothetical protein
MKSSTGFFICFGLLILLVCSSCGSGNYEEEMNAAQQAMDEAKSIRTEDYAPADWEEAVQAWDQAQTAVKENKPAKNLFLKAKSRFEKAVKIAESRRTTFSNEVVDLQTSIDVRYAKLKSDFEKARLKSAVRNKLQPVFTELDEGCTSLSSLIEEEDYLEARTVAQDVNKKILNAELIMAGKDPLP